MCYRLLLLGAALGACSLMIADDLTPLQLAAPDAPIVIGVNAESIRLAYARSRYWAMLTPEYRAQYEQGSKALGGMLGFDLTRLQEIVISVRPGPGGKSGQGLAILRGSFDPDHPPALLALMRTERSVHEGVPVIVIKPDKGDPVAVAFLGRTLLVGGDPASVRAAITRWRSGVPAHSPWLARMEEMNRVFHVWCLAPDLQSAMPHGAALPKGADAITAALHPLEEITVGMTLVPDFNASVELLAHTPKDAAELQGAVSMGLAAAMMQPEAQKAKDLLKGVQVTTQDRTVRISLVIPEEKLIEAAREQMKQGSTWMGGPGVSRGGGEVVVQGGEPAGRPAAATGDTQVIVLPR